VVTQPSSQSPNNQILGTNTNGNVAKTTVPLVFRIT
jgi:hypothetical protein